MSLTNLTTKTPYAGNGVTTVFPFTFKVFQAADLVVTETTAAGVTTTLVLNTDYTVTGAGLDAGGSITRIGATSPPPTGTTGLIRRVLALTQTADIRNQSAFYAAIHEDVFDKLAMVDQQQEEEIGRSLQIPEQFSAGVSNQLPKPLANATLVWDPTATFLQNGNSASSPFETLNPAMDGVVTPGARGTVARGDHVHPTDTSRAPTTSPTFTGTVDFTGATLLGATASKIGFTQNATGALAQTLNDKSQNTIHLTDFMTSAQLADVEAKTGAADMSSAFTLALAYLAALTPDGHTPYGAGRLNNRPTLVLPGCSLKVTQGFNINFPGFRMIGQGKGNTAIYYNTNSPIVLFDFGTFSATPANLFTGAAQQWSFEELTLVHSNGETAGSRTCSAIRDNGCGNGYLKNTLFIGWQYGLNAVYGSDFTTTDNADFQFCDYGAYWGPGTQQCSMFNSQFYFCYVGVMLEYGQEVNMWKPVFAGPQLAAIYVYNQASGTTQLTSFPGQGGWAPALNCSVHAPHFESNNGGAGASSIPTYFVLYNATVAWTTLWMRDVDIVAGTDGTHYVNALVGSTGSVNPQYIYIENVQFIGAFQVGATPPGYMFHNSGGNSIVKNWHSPSGSTTPLLADTSSSTTLYYDDWKRLKKVVNGGLPWTDQITDDGLTTGIQHVYAVNGVYSMGFYNAGWIVRYGIDIQNRRVYLGDPSTPTTSWSFDTGSAIPGSGSYMNGSFRWNNGAPNNTGWALLGWTRLTTGSANVAGTDWNPIYVPQNVVGGAVASAATITLTGPVTPVSGTNAISTINLPYAGFTGPAYLMPTGAFTLATGGNIAKASTAVVGQAMTIVWDGVKWNPSY